MNSSKEHNDPLSRFTTDQKTEYWELFHRWGKRYAEKVFAQKYPELVFVGPKGGRYRINEKGRKVYDIPNQ